MRAPHLGLRWPKIREFKALGRQRVLPFYISMAVTTINRSRVPILFIEVCRLGLAVLNISIIGDVGR